MHFGFKGWSAIYGSFWPQPSPKYKDLLRRATHYVMRAIAFVEDPDVIKKILKHLGLWEMKSRPPPKSNAPPPNVHIDYSDSQVSTSEDYLYVDAEYPEAISA
jgi:hypothetical protein